MTNKINPIHGIIPAAQEPHKKSTDASKVGKDVSRALNEAVAMANKSANRRVPPGGGRLNSRTTTKKTSASSSDHEEEELFHHAIAPIEKGHDGHNDHRPHPEVPDQHVILPMAEKTAAQTIEKPQAASVPSEKATRIKTMMEDSANQLKRAVEKQTAVMILKTLKETIHSKDVSIYRKIYQIPSHFLGVVAKKLFDLGMWIPRRVSRPILKHGVRPILLKLFPNSQFEFLEFKKPIALSFGYKGFITLAKVAWAIPATFLSAFVVIYTGVFSRGSKKEQAKASVETDDSAKIRAERQEQFRKDAEDRKKRIARQAKLKAKTVE